MVIEDRARSAVELCRVGSNPNEIAKGAFASKRNKGSSAPMYMEVTVFDTEDGDRVVIHLWR